MSKIKMEGTTDIWPKTDNTEVFLMVQNKPLSGQNFRGARFKLEPMNQQAKMLLNGGLKELTKDKKSGEPMTTTNIPFQLKIYL